MKSPNRPRVEKQGGRDLEKQRRAIMTKPIFKGVTVLGGHAVPGRG